MGIVLSETEGFNAGKPYFEKCLQPFSIGENKIHIKPDDGVSSEVYYYLALYSLKEKNRDEEEIGRWLETGLKKANPSSKTYRELKYLYHQFSEKALTSSKIERVEGKIKYYNIERRFGIIESEGMDSIFFRNGFILWMDDENLQKLGGKEVTYIEKDNQRNPNLKVATDICFLDNSLFDK